MYCQTNLNYCMKRISKILAVAGSCLLAVQVQAGIKISELMPCNISTYMDRGGDEVDSRRSYNFPGWVELYNDGEEESLKGYTISHCKQNKDGLLEFKSRCVVEEDIKVGEGAYQVLFFDGETKFYKHMPFKLDSDGGSVALYKNGELVDSLTYGAMETHISYGRDSSSVAGYMNPTPKEENGKAYRFSTERVKKPKFVGQMPGVVNGTVRVELSCASSGAEIYYTTNGAEPRKIDSALYNGPIEIDKTTVVRARAFRGDEPASEILTGTFLYMDKYHESCGGFTVPIVSVSTDDMYLKDPMIGFLLKSKEKSKNGAEFPESDCLRDMGKVNILQEHWNRPVVVEYIEDGKVTMVHEAEAGVMGGCSRGWDVASLKLKAGSKVGSTQKEFVFTHGKSPFKDKPDNKYKSFHLRNGGNAGNVNEPGQIRIRDGFMQSLTKDMNVDYQAFQTVAYYLNGKYQGLMGLRERTNEDYVEANYGLEDDEVDVMKTNNDIGVVPSNGTTEWYDELIKFIESNDPASEGYYETACKYMDMDEYIDYHVFEHFIVNTDWVGNNTKMWRDRKNGKLRWIIYDTDFGFGLYSHNNCRADLNSFTFATGESTPMWSNDSEWKVTLFKHLKDNPKFSEKFVNKALIHLGSTFTYDRVKSVWDMIEEEAENEYCAFMERYEKNGTSLGDMGGVDAMLNFAKERPKYMYDHMKDFFDVDGYVDFELSSNVEGARFFINGDLLNSSSFSGYQVAGKQLMVEPIAPDGYKFKEWSVQDNAREYYYITKNSQWKYFYQDENPEGEWAGVDYDDSAWEDGKGKMGYKVSTDSEGYNTVMDYGSDSLKPVRAYFRSTFNVDSPSEIDSLKFDVLYDDGFIVYLNGKEIYRKNMLDSLGAGEEQADEQANDWDAEFSIVSPELKSGKNVLAVLLCQNSPESGDLTLRMNMTAAKKVSEDGRRVDESPRFSCLPSGRVELEAIFEKCDCESVFGGYSALKMNEVAPSNDATTDIVDEYGIHSDWFEIYNAGDDTLNLAGLYLSDDEEELGKSLISLLHPDSTKIAPKGFVRFWADNAVYRGPLHADFKLSNKNPTGVYLSAKCGGEYKKISELKYKKLAQNVSYGYLYQNESELISFTGESEALFCDGICMSGTLCPTPGASNALCDAVEAKRELCPLQSASADADGIQVYPNPTEAILNIEADEAGKISVSVYDGVGRLLLVKEIDDEAGQIDMSQFADGTYYLKLVTPQDVVQRTVIKK